MFARPAARWPSALTIGRQGDAAGVMILAIANPPAIYWQADQATPVTAVSSAAVIDQLRTTFGDCACNGIALLDKTTIAKLTALKKAHPTEAKAYNQIINAVQKGRVSAH